MKYLDAETMTFNEQFFNSEDDAMRFSLSISNNLKLTKRLNNPLPPAMRAVLIEITKSDCPKYAKEIKKDPSVIPAAPKKSKTNTATILTPLGKKTKDT